MPIYEFYCADCHTVFSFFTPSPHTTRRPDCPKCQRSELERRPSRFATLKHVALKQTGDNAMDDDGMGFEGIDEDRLEGAMGAMMGEMERLDENDPKAMAHMMRRFGDLAGLEMGGQMEDMVRRLEAGEDPDALEQEMDSLEGGDDGFDDFFRLKKTVRRRRRPRVDDELYFL